MIQQQLQQLIQSTVESLGFELWGHEFGSHPNGALLCVFVESDHGVTVQDCSKLSRQLRAVLAVESSFGDNILLEVSSPGVERALYILPHYQRYLGHRIKVRLRKARDNCRNFVGEIKQVNAEEQTVLLAVEGQEWTVTLQDIEKARLVVEF